MDINGISSTKDTLKLLVKVAQENKLLELMNVYKSVTITQEARIISFGEDFIEFQMPYYQFMCVALQGRTHFRSPGLPYLFSASLENLELTSGKVRLREFKCLSRSFEVRLTNRVAPKEPIRTTLHLKNIDLSASIVDLSKKGMGLLAYKIQEKAINLEPNSLIHLDYYLPGQPKKFIMKGKLAYLKPVTGSLMARLGVCINPSLEQEAKLQKYIYLRHLDIIKELEQAFNRSFEPMRTANIFF